MLGGNKSPHSIRRVSATAGNNAACAAWTYSDANACNDVWTASSTTADSTCRASTRAPAPAPTPAPTLGVDDTSSVDTKVGAGVEKEIATVDLKIALGRRS